MSKRPVDLRRLRLRSGLTQQQVAERIGGSRTKISQYESAVFAPGLRAIIALADAYGVTPCRCFNAARRTAGL